MSFSYKYLLLSLSLAVGSVWAIEQISSIEEIIQQAEQGAAESQYQLAIKYELGDHLQQSYEQAVVWLTKAAQQNHIEAQLKLGMMYFNGQGVARNNVEAAEWFRKAAYLKQGNKPAYYAKALIPVDGVAKALWWLERVAEQKVSQAQYQLAQIYAQTDVVKALTWATIANTLGYQPAKTLLSQLSTQSNSQQQQQAEQLAHDWLNSH